MAYYRPPGPPPDPALVRALSEQQRELHQRLLPTEPLAAPPRFIGGCDSSFPTPDTILSVVVVLRFPSLELVEKAYSYGLVTMPYVPGYLSFREAPNVMRAFGQLAQRPDVLMVDGHGVAHPRRLGIAAHLGVLLDVPSFGVAKQRLTGTFVEPGPMPGDLSPLTDARTGELLGEVLRSKARVQPLFVSAGHRCDQASARHLTLACLRGYKLPEPTRLADHWAEQLKAEVRAGPAPTAAPGELPG